MKLLFCCNPLDNRTVDPDYQLEWAAAKNHDFETFLISYEDLVYNNDACKAIRRIPAADTLENAIFRGWMMKPEAYARLYWSLKEKNIELINESSSYRHCHYLPESYPIIKELTPATIWIKTEALPKIDDIMRMLQPFGERSVILKDYVKSQKHRWKEACFISSANDMNQVESVVRKFWELQGDDLNEGLVFREYVSLEYLTSHSKSGMPLTKEFRVFFLYGHPMMAFNYWDEGEYGGEKPELGSFLEVAKQVQSNFFTMDIAKKETGDWIIIELGDGQVAGLPENLDINEFYRILAAKVN